MISLLVLLATPSNGSSNVQNLPSFGFLLEGANPEPPLNPPISPSASSFGGLSKESVLHSDLVPYFSPPPVGPRVSRGVSDVQEGQCAMIP